MKEEIIEKTDELKKIEKQREYSRRYYEKHKDKMKEYNKNYMKKWRAEHLQEYNEYQNKYYHKNSSSLKEYNNNWRKKKVEQLREQGVMNPWEALNGKEPRYEKQPLGRKKKESVDNG